MVVAHPPREPPAMIKEQIETIVIGAGWAGLGVSHALAEAGISHRVLEHPALGLLLFEHAEISRGDAG
jgi:2-polyprenyl-6-methoxyphenol hydroxylase-like FAD-dependent oxidoreductase